MKSQLGFPQGDKLSASIAELIQSPSRIHIESFCTARGIIISVKDHFYSLFIRYAMFFHVLSLLSVLMFFTV